MDITTFLLARVAEDEAVARSDVYTDRPGTRWQWVDNETDELANLDGEYEGAISLRTVEEFPLSWTDRTLPAFVIDSAEVGDLEDAGAFRHIARWDPARVLAECEAKRRIVEATVDYIPELQHGDNGEWAFDLTLRLLALPYADHPAYREEWRP